ncbi:unnamed protein product [Fraxinus pennsylvanica]|uniref:Uncharacterized protein n=1 Tax=Fraxinus pennsylvanica TaxID=56036 RepID=A0AAD2DGZ6_9LAMI|nr:unnamed protein product [Fraxinus pennsylvanica]
MYPLAIYNSVGDSSKPGFTGAFDSSSFELPAWAGEESNVLDDKDDRVLETMKSSFNHNEMTKSGKVLPKRLLEISERGGEDTSRITKGRQIVHPGGHVELHDRPIFASDLLNRNPKCCVTKPTVFRHPWDIVPPDATLMPGEKYYVVPLSTIRKLQLKHLASNNFLGRENQEMNQDNCKEKSQNCWLFKNKKGDDYQLQNCSTCLLKVTGMKMKGSTNNTSSEEMKSSSNFASDETKSLTKKRNKKTVGSGKGGSDNPTVKLTSLDNNWQPNLEIIREE